MFPQRPFLVRCSLACVTAVLSLFAATTLLMPTTTPIVTASINNRPAAITPTDSFDLFPGNGTFIDQMVGLPGVQNGFAIWGDCNNDEALDVLLAGQVSSTLRIARVYQRQANSFTQAAAFTDVVNGAAAWGDYDNDGWLDFVLTGESAGIPVSRLYHNERSATCAFSLVNAQLIGVQHSTVAWGDYNADGQLDLLLAGDNGSGPVTKIYHNDHGSFSDSGLNLPGIQDGVAAWGDYTNDGLADLLLTGSASGGPLTGIYRNDGNGGLIDTSTSLPALRNSAAAWGDYNNDGYLDLLLEGATITPTYIADIYNNQYGTFFKNNNANVLMGSPTWTSAAWGDYDADGYLDALVTTSGYAKAYRNENTITGSFASGVDVGLPLASGTVAWGDYYSRGSLDVLLTGRDLMAVPLTKIYSYLEQPLSVRPDPPENLTSTIVGSQVILRWSSDASDDHTPVAGLSYNLRVGTQRGGIDIIAPMAITDTGHRLLPAIGNMYQVRAITLSNLQLGKTYYWSVQAIDTSFLGSRFATEGSFQIPYRVYLPVVLKDLVNYYTNEGESEPNNTYLQSNGPLESGRIYQGVHNDEKDYYSVRLPVSGTLNIDMGSPNGGTQIQLFYQIADVAHRVGYDLVPPYHISHMGEPGWYYVYVNTNPAFVGTQAYTLTVTYP